MSNIAIIGSSGSIGSALLKALYEQDPQANLYGFSRSAVENTDHFQQVYVDYQDEESIALAAQKACASGPLDLVIVATGILHQGDLLPEKSAKEINASQMARVLEANTIFPALVAKHFLPKMQKKTPATFAALSARVGSISDNHLGGWYAYRASKAALNMTIKNLAIEYGRFYKALKIVSLHPGTVQSTLSKPYSGHVAPEKYFTPEDAAGKLLNVLEHLQFEDSGKCFAWDQSEILP